MPAQARPGSVGTVDTPAIVSIAGREDAEWTETLRRIRAFVTSRTGDPELAADITQDVVVRSIASGALDRVDDVGAWLYRSARNAVIDHHRTRRVHSPLPDPDLWPDPDTSPDLPNEATRELAACLMPMLGRLPAESRDALTRVDLEGQTHRQAADQLGISVSGMKSRVQRARHRLKDLVCGCCAVQVDHAGAISDYVPGAGCDGCGCSG
jgi:RNA polymerase sigma-70 factor (ECF subfamily)